MLFIMNGKCGALCFHVLLVQFCMECKFPVLLPVELCFVSNFWFSTKTLSGCHIIQAWRKAQTTQNIKYLKRVWIERTPKRPDGPQFWSQILWPAILQLSATWPKDKMTPQNDVLCEFVCAKITKMGSSLGLCAASNKWEFSIPKVFSYPTLSSRITDCWTPKAVDVFVFLRASNIGTIFCFGWHGPILRTNPPAVSARM